jgi:hypothetical protein
LPAKVNSKNGAVLGHHHTSGEISNNYGYDLYDEKLLQKENGLMTGSISVGGGGTMGGGGAFKPYTQKDFMQMKQT